MSRTLMASGVQIAGLVIALATLGVVVAEAHTPAAASIPTVVRRVGPAVVSITTRQIERDELNRPVATRGLGSGVIVDARGYVLTNRHVVESAEQIKVGLSDGRTFRGALVGDDAFTDLAVVKIDGTRLPTAVLGDSSRLAVGQTVIAIGSPLWLEGGPTVTVGVVSALGRSMEEPGLPILHDLVQTDAAINPGNSGGPLLDLEGRVVGINTAMIPSAHGIGFAIASNTASPVLRVLIATGRLTRPSLGLVAVSVTPQLASMNELPLERGVLVVRIEPGGSAAAAGLDARRHHRSGRPGRRRPARLPHGPRPPARRRHRGDHGVARRRDADAAGDAGGVPVMWRLPGTIVAALGLILVTAPIAASETILRIVVRETAVTPAWLRVITGVRVDFVNASGRSVHVEFGADGRQHDVIQIPATGPIWAVFHRPGTHPYVVHVYGRSTVALQGVVEVVEDATHRWDSKTCGAVVMGECLEP